MTKEQAKYNVINFGDDDGVGCLRYRWINILDEMFSNEVDGQRRPRPHISPRTCFCMNASTP
jgi:hypothetical protein